MASIELRAGSVEALDEENCEMWKPGLTKELDAIIRAAGADPDESFEAGLDKVVSEYEQWKSERLEA